MAEPPTGKLEFIREENSSGPQDPPPAHAPPSPVIQRANRKRAASSASHVDLDFFDPQGVQQLRRKMTITEQEKEYEDASPAPSKISLPLGDDTFDFAKTLRHLIKEYVVLFVLVDFMDRLWFSCRRDGANIKSRELGVMFQDLRVVGLGASASFQPTLGSVLNPLNLLDVIHDYRHPSTRDLLDGFDGVVRPGEMLR